MTERLVDHLAASIAEQTRRPSVLTEAETARALAVVCPLSWCSAFPGEWCISRTRPGMTVPPHQHRLVAAGVIEQPPAPTPAPDLEERSA